MPIFSILAKIFGGGGDQTKAAQDASGMGPAGAESGAPVDANSKGLVDVIGGLFKGLGKK